jgi:hypothetical protein
MILVSLSLLSVLTSFLTGGRGLLTGSTRITPEALCDSHLKSGRDDDSDPLSHTTLLVGFSDCSSDPENLSAF